MIKKYSPVFIALFMVIFTWFAYRQVIHLYLFNDEWVELGSVYKYGLSASLHEVPIPQLFLGRNRLIGAVLNNLFFLRFRDNVAPIALFGLAFHCINGLLIYVVTKRATKNTFIGSIAAVFFVSSSVIHQALTWPAATTQTVSSITFLLLSLYFAFRYQQEGIRRNIVFALVALYVSFLLRDNTIIVLPVLGVMPFLFGMKRLKIKNIPWYAWVGIISLLLLAFYKTIVYFDLSRGTFLAPYMLLNYLRWGVNLVFYPVVSVAHFFVPFPYMLKLAHGVGWYYSLLQRPPFTNVAFELLSETVLSDVVSVFLSFVIIVILFVLCFRRKEYKPTILLFVLFYILTFVPIALFLNERNTSYVESRYLYACVVPFSVLIGISIESLIRWVSLKLHISFWRSTMIIGLLFSFFVYKQMIVIQRNVATAVDQSNQIRDTANAFLRIRPRLPNKPIIYLESDSIYYVGAPVPFQLGPGYILMIKYYPTGVVPTDFLIGTKEQYYPFLYHYVDQGYKELGGKGFGYFSDKLKLVQLFTSDTSLSVDQLVGFRYVGAEHRLIDITDEIRQYIRDLPSR